MKNQQLTQRTQSPFAHWQKEMKNLLSKFDHDVGSFDFQTESFYPKVEVQNKESIYLVKAEIPGMTEKDIEVSFNDNCLILEGERKTESKEERDDYFASEFSYGSFYRSIPLEESVNPESIKATYKDGILSVELTKVTPNSHQKRKIAIMKS